MLERRDRKAEKGNKQETDRDTQKYIPRDHRKRDTHSEQRRVREAEKERVSDRDKGRETEKLKVRPTSTHLLLRSREGSGYKSRGGKRKNRATEEIKDGSSIDAMRTNICLAPTYMLQETKRCTPRSFTT